MSQIWPVGTTTTYLPCPFDTPPLFSEHCLSFLAQDVTGLSGNSPFLALESGIFPRSLVLFEWRVLHRHQYLRHGVLPAPRVSLLPGTRSGQSQEIEYIEAQTHGMHIFTFTYIEHHEFTPISPIPVQHCRVNSLRPFFRICNALL